MARYIYNGDEDRVFPSLGITVKKGESFDGPEGLRARGLSLDSNAKSAPAVPTAPKEAVKETNKTENKQSASSDITAGA
jgi:hypothetical protein